MFIRIKVVMTEKGAKKRKKAVSSRNAGRDTSGLLAVVISTYLEEVSRKLTQRVVFMMPYY